jgi:3-oxoacyl-[acyl-carrier protein] reductase
MIQMSHNPPRLLAGKKVLVTGGSRGLGRALCLAFTKHGAETAFTWNKNQSAAEKTVELCAEAGTPPVHFHASVLDSTAIAAMVKELEQRWGGIDILVNNAGVSQNLPLALMEEADWDFVMDTNVKGTFLMSRAVLRGMFYRKAGVILNLGSLAGVRMIEAPLHYYTSKAAIKGFTEALAKEVSRHNVRVLCLAPGLLEDGVGRNLPDHKRDDYLRHCALGRVGNFAEVAEFAAFLVSDLNSYQNGATVVMDGCV